MELYIERKKEKKLMETIIFRRRTGSNEKHKNYDRCRKLLCICISLPLSLFLSHSLPLLSPIHICGNPSSWQGALPKLRATRGSRGNLSCAFAQISKSVALCEVAISPVANLCYLLVATSKTYTSLGYKVCMCY